MRFDGLRLFTLLALGLAAACGRIRPGNDPERTALIYFANRSSEQAAVYAASAADEVRIGTVGALRTDTLRVPQSMVVSGSMVVFARLLAKREIPSTGTITVWPGVRYEVRLSSDARTMTVFRAD